MNSQQYTSMTYHGGETVTLVRDLTDIGVNLNLPLVPASTRGLLDDTIFQVLLVCTEL